ncbi:MAG: DUF4343 domain-containing protein [Sphingobacteriales bacterium]|nr:MAG: DUF4343 domain-containing protein [Sphingobacteriales bacterium]
MKRTFEHLGIQLPDEDMSYPESLRGYLGRNIWTSTADEIAADPTKWDVFIKPKSDLKRFTGKHIRGIADLRNIGDQGRNTPVWVSEPVRFMREWRVFVRYGRIMGIRPYKGDYRVHYDVAVIESAIRDFAGAPAGYAIDFGVTDDGRTLLIEVNEGYSIGAYGLYYTDYAKLLSARWAQLTGYEDLCNF